MTGVGVTTAPLSILSSHLDLCCNFLFLFHIYKLMTSTWWKKKTLRSCHMKCVFFFQSKLMQSPMQQVNFMWAHAIVLSFNDSWTAVFWLWKKIPSIILLSHATNFAGKKCVTSWGHEVGAKTSRGLYFLKAVIAIGCKWWMWLDYLWNVCSPILFSLEPGPSLKSQEIVQDPHSISIPWHIHKPC